MKKILYLSVVLILIAASAVPVLAAGPSNGHGNGNGNGVSANQGNSSGTNAGDRNQEKHQNQDRNRDNGVSGNGNQQHMRMRTPFYLQGTISAISASDAITDTVTVTLTHGNAQVKQYLGADLTIQVNDSTLIFKLTQGDENGSDDMNRVPIPFDQLAVGQKVAIHGNVVEGDFIARLITVYIRMPVGETSGG